MNLFLPLLVCSCLFWKVEPSDTVQSDFDDISLHFPKDFRPIKKHDLTLGRLIKLYMRGVYPRGPQEGSFLAPLLSNETKEKPFRASRLVQAWFPLECKHLGMDLRKVGTIHKGRRNLVLKLWDRRGRKAYVWKRYENPDEYTAEIGFFMVADHPNIVKATCVQRDGKTKLPGILMDFVAGGSSLNYARENSHRPERIVKLCAQMYDVLKYMHWLGFVHADFKPENVMIDENGNAKAIDFGFAIRMPHYRYYRGTPTTLAPELVKAVEGPIMENIDIWALGSSIAQLFGTVSMQKLTSGSKRGHKWVPMRISKSHGYMFGKVPTSFSIELKELLYFTMNPDPNLRMFNTLSQLEWFESLSFWNGIDLDTIGYQWSEVRWESYHDR